MKYIQFIIVIILFVCPLNADENDKNKKKDLTLSESIQLAMANNRQIQLSKQIVSDASAKVDESKSYHYPQLNIDSSYTRLNNIPEFLVPGLGAISLAIADNYSYKATVSQALFSWNKITKGVSLSKIELDLTTQGVAMTKREITYAVVQIFYQLLTTQEAIKVMDDNIHLLEQRLDMIKKKYEAGEMSDFDILSTAVQISSAQGQKLDAVNGLNKLRLQFNLIIGRAASTPVILAGSFDYNQMDVDENLNITNALANRIEILQIHSKGKMAQLQKELAATSNKPNLNTFATWELRNGNQPDVNDFRGAWTFGAMLSFPLFDGWRTNSQVRQANIYLATIQIEYDQKRQEIETEVKQAILDIKSAWQKIEISKLTVTQAEQAFQIAEERYGKGLIDTLDLLSSQQSLAASKLNNLQSVYNYNLSKYNLEKVVGQGFTITD
jgi:outer membrane protein